MKTHIELPGCGNGAVLTIKEMPTTERFTLGDHRSSYGVVITAETKCHKCSQPILAGQQFTARPLPDWSGTVEHTDCPVGLCNDAHMDHPEILCTRGKGHTDDHIAFVDDDEGGTFHVWLRRDDLGRPGISAMSRVQKLNTHNMIGEHDGRSDTPAQPTTIQS